jgi:hypothetical protein
MGSVVLLPALLKGMGHEVDCEVIARRLPHETSETLSSLITYSDCRVLTAPSDLPDGEYAIHLNSQVIPTLRRRGKWI